VRTHVLGLEDVQPTPAQMEAMRELVRREMQGGAMGIGSALIYAPGTYAKTEELVRALQGGGALRRHVHLPHPQRGIEAGRGDRRAEPHQPRIPASAPRSITSSLGKGTWRLMDEAIAHVERARAEGFAGHREHVPLYRELHGPLLPHPFVGP
jgi:N-acyl-D-amino-acid deacylase